MQVDYWERWRRIMAFQPPVRVSFLEQDKCRSLPFKKGSGVALCS